MLRIPKTKTCLERKCILYKTSSIGYMEFGWRWVDFVMFGSGWELRGRWVNLEARVWEETNAAQKHEHERRTFKCDPIVSGQPGNVLQLQLLPKHTVPFFARVFQLFLSSLCILFLVFCTISLPSSTHGISNFHFSIFILLSRLKLYEVLTILHVLNFCWKKWYY